MSKVYKFNELSEHVQKKIIENFQYENPEFSLDSYEDQLALDVVEEITTGKGYEYNDFYLNLKDYTVKCLNVDLSNASILKLADRLLDGKDRKTFEEFNYMDSYRGTIGDKNPLLEERGVYIETAIMNSGKITPEDFFSYNSSIEVLQDKIMEEVKSLEKNLGNYIRDTIEQDKMYNIENLKNLTVITINGNDLNFNSNGDILNEKDMRKIKNPSLNDVMKNALVKSSNDKNQKDINSKKLER